MHFECQEAEDCVASDTVIMGHPIEFYIHCANVVAGNIL